MQCDLCGSGQHRLLYPLENIKILRCCDCGLVFTDLCAKPDNLSQFYFSDYYTSREEYYFQNSVVNQEDGIEHDSIHSFKRILAELSQLRPRQGRLLDVGCAMGIFLKLAVERGWRPSGVDISSYGTKFAREQFGVDARCGNLMEVGFPTDYFDVVTMWDVIEHFPRPSRQLQEVRRILKPDGLLYLNTPNQEALMRRLAHLLFLLTGGTFKYPVAKLYHQFHVYYYSPHTIRRQLEQQGFRVCELRKKTIPIAKARGNRLEKQMVRALSGLEKVLGMEFEIEIYACKKPGRAWNHETTAAGG